MDNNQSRPYFLWDYDLTEDDVKKIVSGGNEVEKRWILGRILTSAKFSDVWKYTTAADLAKEFPYLRLRPGIRAAWQRALTVWGYHV